MRKGPPFPPWLRLRELRLKANLTCAQLGAHVGRAEPTIFQMEAGYRRPGVDTMHRLAGYFGQTYEELARTLPPPAPGMRAARALVNLPATGAA